MTRNASGASGPEWLFDRDEPSSSGYIKFLHSRPDIELMVNAKYNNDKDRAANLSHERSVAWHAMSRDEQNMWTELAKEDASLAAPMDTIKRSVDTTS